MLPVNFVPLCGKKLQLVSRMSTGRQILKNVQFEAIRDISWEMYHRLISNMEKKIPPRLTVVQWLFGLGILSVHKTDFSIRSASGAVIYGITSVREQDKPVTLMVYFIAGISFCCFNYFSWPSHGKSVIKGVKSAYEPSGLTSWSLSCFQYHEATTAGISTLPWVGS